MANFKVTIKTTANATLCIVWPAYKSLAELCHHIKTVKGYNLHGCCLQHGGVALDKDTPLGDIPALPRDVHLQCVRVAADFHRGVAPQKSSTPTVSTLTQHAFLKMFAAQLAGAVAAGWLPEEGHQECLALLRSHCSFESSDLAPGAAAAPGGGLQRQLSAASREKLVKAQLAKLAALADAASRRGAISPMLKVSLASALQPTASEAGDLSQLRFLFQDDLSILETTYEQRARGVEGVVALWIRAESTATMPNPAARIVFELPADYPALAPNVNVDDWRGGLTGADRLVLQDALRARCKATTPAPTSIVLLAKLAVSLLHDACKATALAESRASAVPDAPLLLLPATAAQLCQLARLGGKAPALQHVDLGALEALMLAALDLKFAAATVPHHGARPTTRDPRNTSKDGAPRRLFDIVGVENVLSPAVLAAFQARQASMLARPTDNVALQVAPCVAFHGTWQLDSIQKIADGGLLAPGELNERTGDVIATGTGARYGSGIYLSPRLLKPHAYARGDSRHHYQVFFSLVLLGVPTQLPANDEKALGKILSEPRNPDEDSRICPDGIEYVVPFSDHVLPVFLVTYCDHGTEAQGVPQTPAAVTTYEKSSAAACADSTQQKQKQRGKSKCQTAPHLLMTRVPSTSNHWLLPVDARSLQRQLPHVVSNAIPSSTRLVLILDKSRSMGTSFAKVVLPACAELFRAVRPECASVVLFGEKVETLSNVRSAAFFESDKLVNLPLEDATDLAGGLLAAVGGAVKDHRELQAARHRVLLAQAERELELESAFSDVTGRGKRTRVKQLLRALGCKFRRGQLVLPSGDERPVDSDDDNDGDSDSGDDDGDQDVHTAGKAQSPTYPLIQPQDAPIAPARDENHIMLPPGNENAPVSNAVLPPRDEIAEYEAVLRARDALTAARLQADSIAPLPPQTMTPPTEPPSAENSRDAALLALMRTCTDDDRAFLQRLATSVWYDPTTKLPPAYNRMSADPEMALRVQKRLRRLADQQRVVFLFVLMSDGGDTVNDAAFHDKALSTVHGMVKDAEMPAVFKVLGIGKSSNTKFGMQAKMAVQNCSLWESVKSHYVPNIRFVPRVIRELTADLEQLHADGGLRLSVPHDEHAFKSGFLASLVGAPVAQVLLPFAPEVQHAVIFHGTPPRNLTVNGWTVPVQLELAADVSSLSAQAAVLKACGALVMDLKARVVAGWDGAEAVQQLRDIVKSVKAQHLSLDKLARLSAEDRVALMREKKLFVTELETLLNTVETSVLLRVAAMKADEQALWINPIPSMRYGGAVLRRATMNAMGDVVRQLKKVYGNLDLPLEQPATVPRSVVSGCSMSEHELQICRAVTQQEFFEGLRSPTELLYSFGALGYGLRIHRSEAAVANPWVLGVLYVSSTLFDTASAMVALDAKLELRDARGQIIEDVLVCTLPHNSAAFRRFAGTMLHDIYSGVVFTRNPDVCLPAQKTALLMIALVSGVNQLLTADHRSLDTVAMVFNILMTVRTRITAHNGTTDGYWVELLGKTLGSTEPGKFMTEAEGDDVGSVAKLLAPMCCLPEVVKSLGLFHADSAAQLAEVALALMAETASRGARARVAVQLAKSRAACGNPAEAVNITMQDAAHVLLVKALGITPDSCCQPTPDDEREPTKLTHADSFDFAHAKLASGAFFGQTWPTNCPLQSVVACLVLARTIAQFDFPSRTSLDQWDFAIDPSDNALFCAVLEAFNGASMAAFFRDFVPVPILESSADYQIALFIQGLACFNSRTRKGGVPSLVLSPSQVTRDIARQVRRRIYEDLLAAKVKRLTALTTSRNSAMRLTIARGAQSDFGAVHAGLPTLFTAQDIMRLNATRPATDQLELLPASGLLKHHCAYPQCPLYLQNMSSQQDLVRGTRHGLFRHFKYFTYPDRLYVPGFHETAARIFAKHNAASTKPFTLEVFSEKMTKALGHKVDLAYKETFPVQVGLIFAQLQS